MVALVVFGPEKLPELARTLGKYTADFRRMTNEFKGTFEGHMRDLEREADERRRPTTPPAPVATPAHPAENSIAGQAAHGVTPAPGAAEPELITPAPTPAEGIVPSADPRIPVQPPTEAAAPDHEEETVASTETHADDPEPLIDGQHHSS